MKTILLTLLALLSVISSSAKEPLKAIIVTGQNNHNWRVSHVALKSILENSGMFSVDFAISPESGADMSSFVVDFAGYDLVVLDYNGDRWPEATDNNFMNYVNAGGGVIVYHAANNAFADWPEFNEVIALGGWGGRTETAGPYTYLENGKLIKDSSAGACGSHGAQHQFAMQGLDTHPIVKGLPKTWKHAIDELYDRMRGPANIKSLLYSAQSEKSADGSGRNEPLIFTVDKGKARILHTMIGHAGVSLENNPAMQCTGFQVTLLRGAEWAATGRVTQKVPTDFPTAEKVSMRPEYK